MFKAIKVIIYPTHDQQMYLAQAFGCVRWVWNQSLSVMSLTYKETGKGLSAYDIKKQIPIWKTEFEWLKKCYSQCLQHSILNLSQAFINFFDGQAQYPTFKNWNGQQSIQYPQNVKVLTNKEIKFSSKLGTVTAKVHRSVEGTLKTVTVSRMPDGRYYASLFMENGIVKPEQSTVGKAIGIDLGLIDFAVTSDGSKYHNPRHLKKHEHNLKRKQCQLSRKQNQTTANRHKAQRAAAKVHSKISRVRFDFLHKLSRKTVNENQVIVVENQAVKNMVKNHHLAKSISDTGWGMFTTMLKYKAEPEGTIYLEIGRFFGCIPILQGRSIPADNLLVISRDLLPSGASPLRIYLQKWDAPDFFLHLLSLGTSDTALGGSVRPKRYERKSTTVAVIPDELGNPGCTVRAVSV